MVDDLADKTLYNEMDDIAEFIQRWDDENHPVNRSNPTILTSLFGNINDNGQAGLYRSAELSPHQRDFVESIEEGVRDLVLAIADENGWITYCSCAGHRYPNTTIPPAERHVGILPRSDEELAVIDHRIDGFLDEVREATAGITSVETLFGHGRLSDAKGRHVSTAEIWFAKKAGAEWDEYFSELETVYQKAVATFVGHD